MDIVIVDKFLFCLKLETGAYILGTLGVLSNLTAIALLALGLAYAIYYFNDFVEIIKSNLADFPRFDPVLESQALMISVIAFIIFLSLISLFASIQLIRGTRNRNCHQLVPYMILIGLGIIVAFLQLLEGTLDAVINTAINVIINGYIFICINSLYLKFARKSKCKISEMPKSFA